MIIKIKKKVIEWIQCDICSCWQHIICLKIDKNKINKDIEYKCPWCNDE